MISFGEWMHPLLCSIVANPTWHAKWLNTLSFLENCGARKIAACEHPTQVKEVMLKHAAEEFRHAYHLKCQMKKLPFHVPETYALNDMLGGVATLHYLHALDVKTSRHLRDSGFSGSLIREWSYYLVTYAIERRAEELYPIYDAVLRSVSSRVTVKSILLEEEEHLQEMKEALAKLPQGLQHAAHVCAMEGECCQRWLQSIEEDLMQKGDAFFMSQ